MSQAAPTEETQVSGHTAEPKRGGPFISIAFVMAIVLSPVVIATGLLTGSTPAPRPNADMPDISLAALRPSLDVASRASSHSPN